MVVRENTQSKQKPIEIIFSVLFSLYIDTEFLLSVFFFFTYKKLSYSSFNTMQTMKYHLNPRIIRCLSELGHSDSCLE